MTRPLVTLEFPNEVVEIIAARAAEIVLREMRPPARIESEYLTVVEAAGFLRCSPQRVYDLLSQRRLERFKDGRRTLVRRDELVRHLCGERR